MLAFARKVRLWRRALEMREKKKVGSEVDVLPGRPEGTPLQGGGRRGEKPHPLEIVEGAAPKCLLRGGGEGFGFARRSPKGDVGLQVLHHFLELRQVQGLRAIADGFFGRGMHFHDQAVGADGYSSAGYRGDEAAFSGGVARVQNDGRCVNSFNAGMAAMSQVLRVAVSKVRMPRSQRITSGFPWATTYSADISNSFMVLLIPRFSRTGRPHFPRAFSSTKFCMLRAPTCMTSAYSRDQVDVAVGHHFGDDG